MLLYSTALIIAMVSKRPFMEHEDKEMTCEAPAEPEKLLLQNNNGNYDLSLKENGRETDILS